MGDTRSGSVVDSAIKPASRHPSFPWPLGRIPPPRSWQWTICNSNIVRAIFESSSGCKQRHHSGKLRPRMGNVQVWTSRGSSLGHPDRPWNVFTLGGQQTHRHPRLCWSMGKVYHSSRESSCTNTSTDSNINSISIPWRIYRCWGIYRDQAQAALYVNGAYFLIFISTHCFFTFINITIAFPCLNA